MVAGHRRLHAADLAGLKTIPAIVRNLDDDEAVILMVDSNLQRETISRAAEEIQAESISFAVCAYYGIETGENSFGYLATWAKDRELTELRASLETINRTSSSLITDIDRHYAEICKERGLDKETESLAAQPVQEIAVQEQKPVAAPDNGCVPDPAISVESMNATATPIPICCR